MPHTLILMSYTILTEVICDSFNEQREVCESGIRDSDEYTFRRARVGCSICLGGGLCDLGQRSSFILSISMMATMFQFGY